MDTPGGRSTYVMPAAAADAGATGLSRALQTSPVARAVAGKSRVRPGLLGPQGPPSGQGREYEEPPE